MVTNRSIEMNKDKVIFASSLESSSNYIYQIIKNKKILNYEIITHGVGSKLFKEKKIKIDYEIHNLNKIKKLITDIKPKLIFVIPQYNYSIEKKLMEIAISLNIKIISAIDHWYPILERFEYSYLRNKKMFIKQLDSTFIIVNDLEIKNKLSKRFDKKNIKVFGNPILENRWSKKNTNKLEINFKSRNFLKKPIILFISEPYSSLSSKYKKIINPGFNEIEVFNDIIDLVNNKFHLIIKLQPSEKKRKYKNFLKKNNHITIIDRGNIDDIIYKSKKIVGMGSMLLLEAALIRNDVISYRPNENFSFIGNKSKLTKLIKNKKNLELEINKRKSKIIFKNVLFRNSTKKIVNFIDLIMKR